MSEDGPRCETCNSDFHVAENECGEFLDAEVLNGVSEEAR